MNLNKEEIYVLDKKGKTVNPKEVNQENKFFIFHKTFYKDFLQKQFEESLENFSSYFTKSNYVPSQLMNMKVINSKDLIQTKIENSRLSQSDTINIEQLAILNKRILEQMEFAKDNFKKIKIHQKICEKIKENNLSNQIKAVSCLVYNITSISE